jgi:signal transduction histidine kinase
MLNAIQATPPGGSIRVSTAAEDGHALLTVADDGEGIAPEHLALIFRPFFTTKKTGTGLGLSLARRIVEEHGGRIDVDSAPREGARFVVRLPFRRSTQTQQEEAWLASAS